MQSGSRTREAKCFGLRKPKVDDPTFGAFPREALLSVVWSAPHSSETSDVSPLVSLVGWRRL